MRLFLLLFLSYGIVRADGLSDLLAKLGRLEGTQPVKARVDYGFSHQQGEGKELVALEGRASAEVEDGIEGMRIFWNRATLDSAARELAARSVDPDKKAPTKQVMDNLNPQTLADYLNASGNLLRKLEGAQLVDERVELFEGKNAKLLTLKLSPHFNAQDKKYVKQWDFSARIWVGDEGLPLASESTFKVKGRAFLVISFESSEASSYRYSHVGNRLVVVKHEKEESGSGGGEKGHDKSTVSLSVEALPSANVDALALVK